MANPPRHFMARTSCVIKSSPKEWDYEKDTINSLNSHPQLRSLGYIIYPRLNSHQHFTQCHIEYDSTGFYIRKQSVYDMETSALIGRIA